MLTAAIFDRVTPPQKLETNAPSRSTDSTQRLSRRREVLDLSHVSRVNPPSRSCGFSPTAESFGVSAQIGSGVVQGGPEVEGCGVVRALKRAAFPPELILCTRVAVTHSDVPKRALCMNHHSLAGSTFRHAQVFGTWARVQGEREIY